MTEGMGKTAVCSGCGQTFRIGSARPKFQWKSTHLGEDSWVGVAPPEEKKEIKHCIMCQAPLEEGSVTCLACGANQVTGVVHRRRPVVKDGGTSVWSLLPMRTIVMVLVAIAVLGGVWYGLKAMLQGVAHEGVELARQRIVMEAARYLADGGDEQSFAEKFSGRVTDENLDRFLLMLGANDPNIRQAAPLLIACGNVTQVGPIVTLAKSDDPATSGGAIAVLREIGPRRLVELSNDENEAVRRSAAQALCLLSGLADDQQTVDVLAERVATAEKTDRLNRLCRPWPQASGKFRVYVGDDEAPAPATVVQYGKVFYLRLGTGEFRSSFEEERTFSIPIERWCAATGVAVDPKEVRNWVSGSVVLMSPFGSGWQGTARVTARRDLPESPPGFLPTGPMERDQAASLPVRLER